MSKLYKEIYKLDSSQNTRVFWMERNDGAYRTHTGILGGKIVTTDWTWAKPKNVGRANETSPEEQAEAEIVAQYAKKLKTGYTLDIDSVETALEYVQPMLAKNYKDYAHKIDFSRENWVAQVKFNGFRNISSKYGCFTRKGERYKNISHIERALEPFFEENPDAILDGELYNFDLRAQLNELSKLVRKTVNISEVDIKRSVEIVQYHIYDGYNFAGLDQSSPYWCRKDWIDKYITDSGNYNFVKTVNSYGITSNEDLDSMFSQFIENGEEGCILRNGDAGYENKRSKNLLKMKPVDDDEAVITNIKEGQGNWSNAGKIISVIWKNKEFDITFKGTYEDCRQFWQDRESWKGRTITFNYFGLTGLGVPNYGQMDYRNCLKQ